MIHGKKKISKMEKNKDISILEKRMYFLVAGSISDIQKAIQAGHAALEYAYDYSFDPEFIDFVEVWKTWIILNGGTTNNKFELGTGKALGSLNQYVQDILEFNSEHPDSKIKYSIFTEPDLNDALTAICLIVDERVFNREDYPDFKDWYKINEERMRSFDIERQLELYKIETKIDKKTYFLKELLNTKKLA